MEIMKVKSWKEKDQDKKEVDTDVTNVLSMVLNVANSDRDAPKGMDHFRFMRRVSKDFDKAKETKLLCMDESDYDRLKGMVEKNVPAVWGSNKDISEAVEEFLDAKSKNEGENKKEEDPKKK